MVSQELELGTIIVRTDQIWVLSSVSVEIEGNKLDINAKAVVKEDKLHNTTNTVDVASKKEGIVVVGNLEDKFLREGFHKNT